MSPNVIIQNKISSFPVVISDLLPTFYDILGIEPCDSHPINGISILPFLQGKIEKRGQLINWAYNVQRNLGGSYQVVASGDKYKLIGNYVNGKLANYELYDLVTDAGETNDLSKSTQAIISEITSQIEEWRKSVLSSVETVGCLGSYSLI